METITKGKVIVNRRTRNSKPSLSSDRQIKAGFTIPQDIDIIAGIVWAFLMIYDEDDSEYARRVNSTLSYYGPYSDAHKGASLILKIDSLEDVEIIVPDVLCLKDLREQLNKLGSGGLLFMRRAYPSEFKSDQKA